MDRRTGTLLLVTAALWGVPYLLIKIAVGELSPLVIAFGRIAIGAAIVAAVAARRGVLGVEVRGGLLGGVRCLGTRLGYAVGAHMLKRRFAGVEPVAVLAGTLTAAALVLLVPAVVALPSHGPSGGVVAAVVALGIFPTALAFILAYTLIAEIGPSRLSVVAYIAPCFAVVFGAVFRSEAIGAATVAGLLTVLAGSWLAARKG